MSTPRKNLLFLITDQHRWDALGCVNPLVKTPHLDALAARGIHFIEAVCNAPMCMPSRHSLMTGLYPSQLGARHNTHLFARDADAPVPFLPEQMRSAGYQTAGFGKTHWYEHQAGADYEPSARGFEVRAIARGSDSAEREDGALMMGDDEPTHWQAYEEETRPYGTGQESVDGYRGCTSSIQPENFPEGWLTRRALHFLENERDPERPFFLYLSFDKPHAAFNVPPGYEERYDLASIPDTPKPPWGIDEPQPGHGLHDRRSEAWSQLSSDERRLTVLRYYALCSFIDDCFGQVINTLKANGEWEHTEVIFLSDHGEMLGERGWRFSKYNCYEASVRVPLILAGPSIATDKQGTRDDRYAELVDIVPTCRTLAGLPVQAELPGRSLLDDQSGRQGGFCEMHGKGYEAHQQGPTVMWRTREWKLILSLPGLWADAWLQMDTPIGELYDLRHDPGEWHNRYHDPDCLAIREQLTRSLLLHLVTVNAVYPRIPGRPDLGRPETA